MDGEYIEKEKVYENVYLEILIVKCIPGAPEVKEGSFLTIFLVF
jgi:hypothetical protein